MIRSIWVVLNMLIVTPPLALAIIIRSFMRGPAEAFYDRIPRIWAQWALRTSGADVTAIGLENVAPGRPQIFIANHVSWMDVLVLATSIPKRYRFIGKKELARVPLWGRAWVAAGHIPIDRSDTQAAIESLDRAAKVIRQDSSSVIIFPEGTRSATGALLPFKKGAFMLAVHAGIEIVPVAITGTRHMLAKGSWRVRSGRIIVRFGAPIAAAGYSASTREELISRVRTAMEEMLASDVPDQSEANVGNHQRTRP
ncbi:MAG TPA: lysophospholipid acyltransferase family protein [Longimicrobiales bacterium]|nr:lysophospholipid acyltransferase family protein [Longimicrobiales bacterium]